MISGVGGTMPAVLAVLFIKLQARVNGEGKFLVVNWVSFFSPKESHVYRSSLLFFRFDA